MDGMDNKLKTTDTGADEAAEGPTETRISTSNPMAEAASTSKAADGSAWETLDKWPPDEEIRRPGPLDVYTQEEWQQALDYYRQLDRAQLQQEFEDQTEVFNELHRNNAVPAMEAGIDLTQTVNTLERRFYRVKYLFDCMIPTRDHIEMFNHTMNLINEVRGEKMAMDEVSNERDSAEGTHNETGETMMPGENTGMATLGSTKLTLNEMISQGVLQALEEYVAQPDNPQWAREAKAIDEGKEVPRDVAMRRYLIDLALNRVFSKENADHWDRLVTITGVQAFAMILEGWTSKFSEGTPCHDDIKKSLKFIVSQLQERERWRQREEQKQLEAEMKAELRCSTWDTPTTKPHSRSLGSVAADWARRFGSSSTPNRVSAGVGFSPAKADNISGFPRQKNPLGFASVQPTTEQVLFQAVTLLKGVSDRMDGQSNSGSGSGFKLPAIELWKFDGDPCGFVKWFLRYDTLVHSNDRLSENQKLIYLQQHIEEKAQEVCFGEGVDSQTYAGAWNSVLNSFGDQDLLCSVYRDKILTQIMPTDERDIGGIRKLVNTTRKFVNCLERFGQNPVTYSSLAMDCFKKRVPFELQMKVVDQTGKKISTLSIMEFITELDQYCIRREDVSRFVAKTSEQKPGYGGSYGSGPSRQTTMFIQQKFDPVKGWPKCIFCQQEGQGGHAWKNCLITDMNKRRRAFSEKKLCIGCGGDNHYRAQCKSTRKCGVGGCDKSHHTSLHEWYSTNAGIVNQSQNRAQSRGGEVQAGSGQAQSSGGASIGGGDN